MALKYKISFYEFVLSGLSAFLGYAFNNGYVFFAAIIFLAVAFGTLIFADHDDKDYFSVIFDGIFFGLI